MSEFSDLFRHYWWLVFPVFGMITSWLFMSQRHDRANKVLDMIKSYADQGKEPPPELIVALREANFGAQAQTDHGWTPIIILVFLAIAFIMYPSVAEVGDPRRMAPYLFVAVVMAGTAIALLVNKLVQRRRERNRQ